jgi:hypothetical protein
MLKTILILTVAALALAGTSCSTTNRTSTILDERFDRAAAGQLPPGWTAATTGPGEALWAVERDASAPSAPNALKQSAKVARGSFPLCLLREPALRDGFVEVKFRPVSGTNDQSGGLVWRCQDADNYYVARANALENNVTIYHIIKGKRVAFKNVDAPVASNQWHTLRVDFQGQTFAVTFDGKKVIEASDASFAEAGKLGLWTKADSVTLFDDFRCGTK